MRFIPYGRQDIDQADIDAVIEVLKGDYLTTGPAVVTFEKKLCEETGAKYAVAVCNGTAALHAACFAAGLGAGNEVITSPMTFAASANCALYVGAQPIFADIDERTYNIDPGDVQRKVTSRTKAIIPVHYTGQIADMGAINSIAKQCGATVIADGSHAIGATYRGQKLGMLADMTTLSFHPVKHVTTGEGGAILTNNETLYQRLLLFRTHGITRDEALLENSEGGWYYEQQLLGYNYRITDIQAALGSSQLRKLKRYVERRRAIAGAYSEAFDPMSGIITPYQHPEGESAWHLYVAKFDEKITGKSRREIYDELRTRGLGVNVHYIPVYCHPYYRQLGYKKGLCPRAEALYEQIITLPLYPGMDDVAVQQVISAVKNVLR